jgi:hypothetical protein
VIPVVIAALLAFLPIVVLSTTLAVMARNS